MAIPPRHLLSLVKACCSWALLVAWLPSSAQLVTLGNNNATQLANLLGGPGVIITNASLNCGSSGAGTFSCSCSAGIADGVILTSGGHSVAVGPNNQAGASLSTSNGFDPDLNVLAGFNTYDKCILEFDIFVTSDTLRFNFVFGSEEYLEWVGSGFNDVFGFFISGPGISGPFTGNSQNLAVVPNTSTPISINTVNNQFNQQYYIYNGTGADAPYNSDPYYVQYDGLTTVLEAKTAVTPCTTYHLKLAIADGSDQVLDSGVFIEANSVSSSGILLDAYTSTPGFPFLVEGCNYGTIDFTRAVTTSNDTTIWFTIGGNAGNGLDYVLIPDSITIPANQSTASLNITPISDNTAEGPEKMVIYIHEPCSNTIIDSVFFIIQDDLIPNTSNDTTICRGTSAQIGASGGAVYAWTPTTGLNNPALRLPTASPATTTTYTVTMSVATCTATDSVKVVIQDPPDVNVGNDTAICIGDTLQLNATAPGAVSLFWSPAIQMTGVNSLTPKFFPTSTRMYVLRTTDVFGCVSYDTIVITVNPLPNANAGPDMVTCASTPVQLNATGGVQYAWSPGSSLSDSTIANPQAFPASTTTYVVHVEDANGCKDHDWVTVTTRPLPSVNAGADKTVCQGQSTILIAQANGSPPFTYSWSPPALLNNPNIPTPLATNLQDTTAFVLTVTNAHGCSNTDTVVITVTPTPIITISPPDTSLCLGATAQLVASGAATYVWSPSTGLSATNIPDPITSTSSTITYTVTGTDVNGCKNTALTTVTVNPVTLADAGPDAAVCNGNVVQLNASGGVSYSWSPSAGLSNATIGNPTASPAVTTTYTVTVTDANGCTDTDDVVVSVNGLPNASAGLDAGMCSGTSIQLNATGGVSYSWSPVTGLSDPNIGNPVASPTSTTTYTVTVTDANGCDDTDDVTITVHPSPAADAGADVAICAGASSPLNGSGGASYSWSPSAGLNDPNIANPVAAPVSTTTYVLTVTDANGCTDTDDVVVTVNPLPIADAGSDKSACINDAVQLQGTGGPGYSWAPATGLTNPLTATPSFQATVTTTFTLTVTDANGCTDNDDVTVTVNPLPIPDAGLDVSSCPGLPVQLSASGGVTYSWTPVAGLDDPNIANPIATLTSTRTYTVTVTDANGCVAADDVTLTIFPAAVADAGPDLSICPGDTVQLTASGGVTYGWLPTTDLSDPSVSSPLASPVITTLYTVTVVDANGCQDDDVLNLTVFPAVNAEAGLDQTIIIGGSIQLHGSGGASYLWSPPNSINNPNSQDPTVTPDSNTMYYLVVTSWDGCEGTDSVFIEVIQATIVDIPTAFTPNGDGLNDIFKLYANNNLQLIQFAVFNRWGQIVFETNDVLQGWDGRFRGEDQPIGSYVYVVRGIGGRGEGIIRQGNVSLLR